MTNQEITFYNYMSIDARISQNNFGTFYQPVVSLGLNSNIEIIDECFNDKKSAQERAKELIDANYRLKCGWPARDYSTQCIRISERGIEPLQHPTSWTIYA